MLSAIPFIASYGMMAVAGDRATVLASRAMAGFGDGLMYPVLAAPSPPPVQIIPVYVAETASKELRSSMNNVTNIAQVPPS
jgi:hypothetical protein